MNSWCPQHRAAFKPLADGFFWVIWDGDTMIAERLGGEWYFPGFEDGAPDSEVDVLAGPIAPPKVPR